MSALLDLNDTDLLDAVRAGDTDAYEALYLRHAAAARGLARALVGDPADAEDLVAETFAKVFATLRAGRGPNLAFRAYLCTTLRHIRYDRLRHDARLELTDDLTRYEAGTWYDDTPLIEQAERSSAARAFAQLPERWQVVLWHTAVEGEPLKRVGPMLGLTPNAVAALAFRARAGLRERYLQERSREAASPTNRGEPSLPAFARRDRLTG